MRRLLRYPAYIAAFVALSTLAGYVTFRAVSPGVTATAPDIRGMDVREAERAARGAGLSISVRGEKYDQSVPPGRVLSQEPAPGGPVKGGAELEAVVSKGPEVRLIPSAIGYKLEEAGRLFAQKGIAVSKVISVRSDTAEKDSVLAQRPAPEEWTGEAITLVVSAGPYDVTYFCPSFTGVLKEDAEALASELGLNVEFKGGGDLPGDLFRVTGQRPLPGDEIRAGDTVYLTIGGGDG